jgi:hypothetical protein
VTIGGKGPVINAGFAVAAAAFDFDTALRAGVLRAAGALLRAWVCRADAADDAGFGLLDALLVGLAAVVLFVVLVDCRVAIEQLILSVRHAQR